MTVAIDKERGFTLIELMIAVVVVGVLAAIALPSYNGYVMRARRTDAKNALLDLAAREERYYSLNSQYSSVPSNLGYGISTSFPINVQTGSSAYYQLTINRPVPPPNALPTFTASAVPIAGINQANDKCGSYTLDQLGMQGNVGNSASVAECW